MPSQPAKIGKYEIVSQLGRGGMGVVYKARDTVIDRIVAVKTIITGSDGDSDQNLIERLHMEARSAGRLHHPNIVTVYDYGEHGALSYIVMEFIEGVNVGRLIEEQRRISLETKLRVLIQVADGLAYAHENGVIHRDMKPSNICVTGRGVAKILDFGLARFDDTKLTKTGFMAGTIAYMSPERLSGETGIKDDIFALGAIAYELLTNHRAFPGATAPEVMRRIIEPTLPPRTSLVAALPPDLDKIIEKALAKEVTDRYDSAAAFSADLINFMRSDAMRTYASQEHDLVPDTQAFVDRPTGTVYVGPGSEKIDAEAPPTMRMETSPKSTVATEVMPPPGGVTTANDVPLSSTVAATMIVPAPEAPRKRAPIAAIVFGILVAGAGAAWFALRPKPAAKTEVVDVQPKPEAANPPKVPHDIVERTELQLATAQSLSAELARRPLSGEEMMRLSEAKGRIAIAEKRLGSGDYDGGAKLLTDSITALQGVMTSSSSRSEPPADRAIEKKAPPGKKQPVQIASAEPVRPQPRPTATPVLVPSRPVEPQPQPQPQPEPVPRKPEPQPQPQPVKQETAETAERRIASFMTELANAYQSKDIDFFRENAVHFSDQLANAIRNSPSVRVQLQISRIDMVDAQHANVHVKRTDWFSDKNAPPAMQNLTYGLARSGDRWQLASIARD